MTVPSSSSVNGLPFGERRAGVARSGDTGSRRPPFRLGVHLEVKVGVATLSVPGVADEADGLAGRDLRAVLEPRRVRRARDALAAVVVCRA